MFVLYLFIAKQLWGPSKSERAQSVADKVCENLGGGESGQGNSDRELTIRENTGYRPGEISILR